MKIKSRILDVTGAIGIYLYPAVFVCGLIYLLYWATAGVAGNLIETIKSTADPSERAGQWIAAAIVFHAFWTRKSE